MWVSTSFVMHARRETLTHRVCLLNSRNGSLNERVGSVNPWPEPPHQT